MLLIGLLGVSTLPTGVIWSYVGGDREEIRIGGRYDGIGDNFSPLNWPGQRHSTALCSFGPYSDLKHIFVCLYFFYCEFGLLTSTKGWRWTFDRRRYVASFLFPFNAARKGSIGRMDDIWEFSVQREQWRWIYGSNVSLNLPAAYGTTQGIFSLSNRIYSVYRHGCIGWQNSLVIYFHNRCFLLLIHCYWMYSLSMVAFSSVCAAIPFLSSL